MRQLVYLTNMLLDCNDQRFRFGGGERYAWTLAQLMRDLGLRVHFFQAVRRGANTFARDYQNS